MLVHVYPQLNLKNKINKHREQKQTHRYSEHFVARWEGVGEMGEKEEGITKYKVVVTE